MCLKVWKRERDVWEKIFTFLFNHWREALCKERGKKKETKGFGQEKILERGGAVTISLSEISSAYGNKYLVLR